MSRAMIALFLLAASLSAYAAPEEGSYAGIWQDVDRVDHYYVIQEKEGRVVVIVLPGVEQFGDTLRFSYAGAVGVGGFRVSTLSSEPPTDLLGRLRLEFSSLEEGVIYPDCDTCSIAEEYFRHIRKVF